MRTQEDNEEMQNIKKNGLLTIMKQERPNIKGKMDRKQRQKTRNTDEKLRQRPGK